MPYVKGLLNFQPSSQLVEVSAMAILSQNTPQSILEQLDYKWSACVSTRGLQLCSYDHQGRQLMQTGGPKSHWYLEKVAPLAYSNCNNVAAITDDQSVRIEMQPDAIA